MKVLTQHIPQQLGPLDFELPTELEARVPPEARGLRRDQVRLMVTHLADDSVDHCLFVDLPDILEPGDLLVANDSATLPAALTARSANGESVVLHISTRLAGDLWVVEPRHTEATHGQLFTFANGQSVQLLVRYEDSHRLWVARFTCDAMALMHRYGRPISYSYVNGQWPLDMYQTVYAG